MWLSGDGAHTRSTASAVLLQCSILSVFIIHMSACDICAHMYVSFTAWWLSLGPHVHTHAHNLFVWALSVSPFGALSCHMQSAQRCIRLCLRVDASKTSTWFDLGHVFWYTTMAPPYWTLWIPLQQTRVVSFFLNIFLTNKYILCMFLKLCKIYITYYWNISVCPWK